MSRVAKAPVQIPNGVEIKIAEGEIHVKGPKGSLQQHVHSSVKIVDMKESNQLSFEPAENAQDGWAHAGTTRANVYNMVHGVTSGFEKTLELVGVGYRVQVKGKVLALSLGFSHPVEYTLDDAVTAEATSPTVLVLRSSNKQILGQVAAEIRAFRPPEPYKGKGIRYAGEQIITKETKKK